MTTRKFLACFVSSIMVICFVGMAEAKKPIRYIDDYSIAYQAEDVWTDLFGYEQACGFDFIIDFDDRFTIHVFEDREIHNIQIRETYTNLDTGFSFEDVASYNIIFDYETGIADHRGVFWRIRVPGEGMVLLDVGGFLQDWYGINWPILIDSFVGKNHDVNGPYAMGNRPPVSYCDLMAEIFPE